MYLFLHVCCLYIVDGSIVSSAVLDKRMGSPCQQDNDDDNSHGGKITIPDLPEDLWRHIHSLMPMRDAARAACLSRAFLQFWRCYPKLTLTRHALCPQLRGNAARRINCIMRNHSGVGLKTLVLGAYDITSRYFDSWLQFAVAPGIEELRLTLHKKYNFPYSLFTDLKVRDSICHIEIVNCAFRPTTELGPFRSLANLILRYVHITSDELECLLSNSHALEKLDLFYCNEIRFLEIPRVLQHLSCLRIQACRRLQVIENKAPKLSRVYFSTRRNAQLLLGEATQMKKLTMYCPYAVSYACAEVLSIMPNLETRLRFRGGGSQYTNAAYQIPQPQAPRN
ncbi:hypothetical protein BS78_02G177500 [Paspalum vaginatum]|nr:hypothetical protein BS78_02G177500 [Paspalum vaginatum]